MEIVCSSVLYSTVSSILNIRSPPEDDGEECNPLYFYLVTVLSNVLYGGDVNGVRVFEKRVRREYLDLRGQKTGERSIVKSSLVSLVCSLRQIILG